MPISLFSILETLMLARALYVAADLNIAEHLSLKPMAVEEIAMVTSSNPSALGRLMFFLDAHDIFKKNDDQQYYLTEFSHYMKNDHPSTIKPFLLHDDETRWNCFGNLGYSISTGKAAFDNLYGTSYFEYLKDHARLNERFNEAMTIVSAQEDAVIAKGVPFEKVVVDIGGGTGQLINEIAKVHPIDQGILFDLPEVIAQADSLHPLCVKKGGSFFDPIVIDADIFILKRILHDWDDAEALKILSNVSSTMRDDATLYIIDGILDYSENKKLLAAIDLVLLTIFQGKERTKKELEVLINNAGLELRSMRPLNDIICIVECKKNK